MKVTKSNLVIGSIGLLLVLIGLVGPQIKNIAVPSVVSVNTVSQPSDKSLLELSQPIIISLKSGSGFGRAYDASRLSSLYADLATLIELEGDSVCIKNTEEIREANKLSGLMLKMNLQGKYPGLKEACNKLVISTIGEENVVLSAELRAQAVKAFRALAWACQEGSK
jgi:hypothetical protein